MIPKGCVFERWCPGSLERRNEATKRPSGSPGFYRPPWFKVDSTEQEPLFVLFENPEKKRMSYPVVLVLHDRIYFDSIFVKKPIKRGPR